MKAADKTHEDSENTLKPGPANPPLKPENSWGHPRRHALRKVQLATIYEILQRGSGKKHAILMGDCNFSDSEQFIEDRKALDPRYIDVWKHIKFNRINFIN